MSISHPPRRFAVPALLCCLAVLGGCAEQELAPIEQKSTARIPASSAPRASRPTAPETAPASYRVVSGDTLYGIAWRFNLDARDIGRWNNLDDFNRIYAGQTLKLRGPERAVSAAEAPRKPVPGVLPAAPSVGAPTMKPLPPPTELKPLAAAEQARPPGAAAAAPAPAPGAAPPPNPPGAATVAASPAPAAAPTPPPPTQEAATADSGAATRSNGGIAWRWPASGKRRGTVAATGAQGVDILGSRGQPVYAAADGQVVYSGNGLRGYGQLIIIKHSDVFLSAYAHNDKLLAGEGTKVKAGQQIALMGDSEADEVMLHFEIRKGGKAVEPTQFLPAR